MNVSETDLADDGRENVHCRTVREIAEKEKAETVVVSAQVGGNAHARTYTHLFTLFSPHNS